ncbi:FecR domain-containing protein [Phytopseudomonas punonensis]|uniref:FecR family protein n=1 Tax=Phytopseudomonas punonensis TaxID=1220495 RepID=A0A1M7CMG4_9GAMM|nr:FecR domain-containing protein [Pseudomonas punonensis]SHL68400.1 FecR family protein [Pseudomonas punonensis]
MNARPHTLSHASLQQAADWYVRLHDERPGSQVRQQWQQWLEQHGEHRDAWQYVERVSQRFGQLQQQDDGQVLRRTLAQPSRAAITRRQGLKSLLLVGAGSLLGWSTWRSTPLPRLVASWTADFATGTGEVRETRLADGTRLWLNATSAVDADFSSALRLLHLRFGEVLIDTARDTRPFFIDSRHGRMQALGTRFSVRKNDDETWLTVFDGTVEVCTSGSRETLRIQAGQQVAFSAAKVGSLGTAANARESWTRHVLAAEDMPLGQLLDELSHFRHGHLGCNPAVADLPVMGYFPLDDSEQSLHLLKAALPIRVQRLTDWWVSVEPNNA